MHIKEIKNAIENLFQLFKENKLVVESGVYEKYSRKNLVVKSVKLDFLSKK